MVDLKEFIFFRGKLSFFLFCFLRHGIEYGKRTSKGGAEGYDGVVEVN